MTDLVVNVEVMGERVPSSGDGAIVWNEDGVVQRCQGGELPAFDSGIRHGSKIESVELLEKMKVDSDGEDG